MAATNFELDAQPREDLGKGASRRLRRADKVLGVVYGGDEAAAAITLEERVVKKAIQNESFFSQLLDLKINGKTQKVVLRDLQRHPYKPTVLHMDFLRVKATDKISMTIPLHFIGTEESPGIKEGGVLNHLINEVEVKCQAGNIPEFIEVDVTNLEMDQSILMSDLKIPSGSELTMLDDEHNPSIASIHKPRAVVEETPADESEGEGEEGSDESAEGDKGEEAKSEE